MLGKTIEPREEERESCGLLRIKGGKYCQQRWEEKKDWKAQGLLWQGAPFPRAHECYKL
jgi:hypothetical protein